MTRPPFVFLSRYIALVVLWCGLALSGAPALAQSQAAEDPQTALAQLIEVLRDDAARAALIAELEAGLDAEPAASEDATAPEAEAAAAQEQAADAPSPIPSEELRSLGTRIAEMTRERVQSTASALSTLWRQLVDAPRLFAALELSQLNALGGLAGHLAILFAVTYGGFLLIRRLAAAQRERLRGSFVRGGWVAKPIALTLELTLNVIAVLIPYALGHAIAVGVLGDAGEIRIEHTLYLNAFLMVELAVALIRTIVSPLEPQQRLIGVTDTQARAIVGWSRVLIGLFVFGQMMVLQLVNITVSRAAGRAVSVLLILITLLVAAIGVFVAAKPVRRKLMGLIANKDARAGLRGPIAHWHLFALGYLGVLAIAALTQPSAQFMAFVWSNAQIGLAILAGFIVLNVIKRMLGGRFVLPEHIRQRSPELERQFDAIAPLILRVARIAVVLAVIIFCLNALGAFDFPAFIQSARGARILGSTFTILGILAAAAIAWVVINTWVETRISPTLAPQATARRRTLLILARNALTIAIIVITLMIVLSEIGINIAPLLASAGVIGLAIGFGAQRLVQDIITGIFIQLEGAIDVGDVVSVAGISGVVERMTIRSVSLRDAEGSYHVIPFSSVAAVTNFMRGFSYAVIEVTVPYREDIAQVKTAMVSAFDTLKKDRKQGRFVIGQLEWEGVNTLSLADIAIRARIKTGPGRQWGVKRAYNALLRDAFVAHFIGVPPDQRPAVSEVEETEIAAETPGKDTEEIALPDPDAGPDSSR